MVVVAIAGGTGAVGRNIVEALLAQGKHEVIILSRMVCYYGSSQ
jgi:nucleoside-diphosphate-sugar epimerase